MEEKKRPQLEFVRGVDNEPDNDDVNIIGSLVDGDGWYIARLWDTPEVEMWAELIPRAVDALSWRHLDNQKPGDGEECLVYVEGVGPRIAMYHTPVNQFFSLDFYGAKPRFWLPLPLPPAPQEKK